VQLSGRVEDWSRRMGADSLDLSMTHSKGIAAAVCVAVVPE
jgi:phosphopantetheinyl transferase (holo-ACP synthase)